jgi:NAD+ kinase
MVPPQVAALVLTPIASHTPTTRPSVTPLYESAEGRAYVDGGADDIYVTYDGQYGYPLERGAYVRIRKADQRLRLVRAPARSYFDLLREKLKWGER